MIAISTWPADDILLSLEGTQLVLYEDPNMSGYAYGTVSMGSVALTIKEAEELIGQLRVAINETKRIDTEYRDYCENEQRRMLNEPE